MILSIAAAEKIRKRSPRGFLPRPLLRAGKEPRQGESFPPDKLFRPAESELKPRHTARILGGQNSKEKCPFLFQKKLVACKSEKQGTFFFGVAERSEAVAGLSFITNF